MQDESKEKAVLKDIDCKVADCIYHFGISGCTAPFVNIENKNAFFSTGTKCNTYKQKQ